MKQEITANEIRKGDLIRKEYAPHNRENNMQALEFRASEDGRDHVRAYAGTLYLLDRPLALPTKPGVYQDGNYLYTLSDKGNWYFRNLGMLPEQMQELLNEKWILLQPVAEVATAIINVLDIADSDMAWGDPLDYAGIIAKVFINV